MISELLQEKFPPSFSGRQVNVGFIDNILPSMLARFQIKLNKIKPFISYEIFWVRWYQKNVSKNAINLKWKYF